MDYERFIIEYGYWALVAGIVVEGETVLVIAGFAAHRQYLHLIPVILVAFAGSLLLDQSFFLLGRYKAVDLLKRKPAWKPYLERIQRTLEKHPDALAIGFRFFYGFRMLTPFAVGYMSGIKFHRFLFLNALGALAWSVVFTFAGFLFGRALTILFDEIKSYEHWVILGLLIAGALAGTYARNYALKRRSRDVSGP